MPNAKSASSKPPDPLDAATERLDRADQATDLLEYSEDFDEPTGRTEVTVNLQHPSQPEITRTESNPPSKVSPLVIVLTVAKKFPAWGAVIVALAAIAAYVFLQTR